jgi:phosphate transport system protein
MESYMRDHTASAFDDDLEWLSRMLAEMARSVERQVSEAAAALVNRDRHEALRVALSDAMVDELSDKINERAILTIARRQPVAVDLREVVGVLHTCRDLEQIGNLAKGIAERAAAADRTGHPQGLLEGMERLARIVVEQLVKVDDTYVARDVKSALSVWHNDTEIDAAYDSLRLELQVYMKHSPRNVESGLCLMFGAASFEQIGNLAARIAATAYYIVEGRTLKD